MSHSNKIRSRRFTILKPEEEEEEEAERVVRDTTL
jgi:hypothetical protein